MISSLSCGPAGLGANGNVASGAGQGPQIPKHPKNPRSSVLRVPGRDLLRLPPAPPCWNDPGAPRAEGQAGNKCSCPGFHPQLHQLRPSTPSWGSWPFPLSPFWGIQLIPVRKTNGVSEAPIRRMKSVLCRGLCRGLGGCSWKMGIRLAKSMEADAGGWILGWKWI